MIPALSQQLFVSLASSAKQITVPHQPSHRVKTKKHSHKHYPIHQYSLENQRRIKNLRSKRVLDSDVIKLLKQEVREHHLTRSHLLSALKSVQTDFAEFKEDKDSAVTRQIALADIHESIVAAIVFAKSLNSSDAAVLQCISRLEDLKRLVKEKFVEVHS